MIESRFVDTFPLNDQEVALRHLHNTAQKFVDDYEKGQPSRPRSASRLRPERNDTMANLPAQFAELERFIDWALPSETERYDKRLASTMDELQDFYDTAFPILEKSTDYLK